MLHRRLRPRLRSRPTVRRPLPVCWPLASVPLALLLPRGPAAHPQNPNPPPPAAPVPPPVGSAAGLSKLPPDIYTADPLTSEQQQMLDTYAAHWAAQLMSPDVDDEA